MHLSVFIAICTMLVPGFLYFGRIQVLNDNRRWWQLAVLASTAALVSFALYGTGFIKLVEATVLSIPIYQLLLFRLCYALFIRWKKREPKDCSLVFSTGLAVDRVFSIIYVLMAIMSPFALIGPLVWGGNLAA